MDVPAVLRDVSEHWHVYATMPIIAALIGYVTKRAAIEMMYRPLEFVGVRPFLGWHGVIPRTEVCGSPRPPNPLVDHR